VRLHHQKAEITCEVVGIYSIDYPFFSLIATAVTSIFLYSTSELRITKNIGTCKYS
jgi:hypothetical protein